MSGDAPARHTVQEFYALLYAMEHEAAERYDELANQMETHNNAAVAALFRELAAVERKHAEKLQAHGQAVQAIRARDMRFRQGFELPETTPLDRVHYLMTPAHALELALENEEQAARCFDEMAASAPDDSVKKLAAEMAEEERRHAAFIRDRLAQLPQPPADWDQDLDPPRYSE
ncbi:MAG TPA: ferritin family protein [Alphaproteobacteria bacterium]|jgi:rubrerythrin